MIDQMVLIFVYSVYILIMGVLIGGLVIQNKEEVKRLNWWQRIILALLLVFWPISFLIGAIVLEENNGS